MKTTTIIITVILAIVIGSYYFIDSNKNSVNYSESKDEIKMAQTLDVMSDLLDIMIDSAKTRYPEILKGWRLNIDPLCKFIESHCSIQLTAAEVSELEKMSSSLRLSIYKFHINFNAKNYVLI